MDLAALFQFPQAAAFSSFFAVRVEPCDWAVVSGMWAEVMYITFWAGYKVLHWASSLFKMTLEARYRRWQHYQIEGAAWLPERLCAVHSPTNKH